jgi:hypothetical protein
MTRYGIAYESTTPDALVDFLDDEDWVEQVTFKRPKL